MKTQSLDHSKSAKLALTLLKQTASQPSDQGATLIEALMALIVATILLSFITPLIFLAVATRVQNRRAEQAMEIAQSEIDQVQVLMAQGVEVANEDQLPPEASGVTVSQVAGFAAPTAIASSTPVPATQVEEVDFDKDGDADFLRQSFRDSGVRFDQGPTAGQLAVFRMGVRVYSIAAAENLGSLQTTPASLQFTSGLGKQKVQPLAVLYTEVSRSDVKLSLTLYEQYSCLAEGRTWSSGSCN